MSLSRHHITERNPTFFLSVWDLSIPLFRSVHQVRFPGLNLIIFTFDRQLSHFLMLHFRPLLENVPRSAPKQLRPFNAYTWRGLERFVSIRVSDWMWTALKGSSEHLEPLIFGYISTTWYNSDSLLEDSFLNFTKCLQIYFKKLNYFKIFNRVNKNMWMTAI